MQYPPSFDLLGLMKHCRSRGLRSQAFTLVELLVVLAIIAILIALLVPAVQYVRSVARNVNCRSNLRQLALASINYESSKGHFPPGSLHLDDDFRTGQHSGFVYLLPHLEQQNVYESYDFNLAWDQGTNANLANANIPVFRCPVSSGVVEQDGGVSGSGLDYAMCKGDSAFLCLNNPNPRGPFDINSKTRMDQVRDGLSQTIFFGEAASDASIAAEAM